jgi:hypothetical protein
MIEFTKFEQHLLMRYRPERAEEDWLVAPLESDKELSLAGGVFTVRREIYQRDLDDGDHVMDACYRFQMGHLEGQYYKIDRHFLKIQYDLYIHESLTIKRGTFVAERNISIFRHFNSYGFNQLYVGGEHADAIPQEVFLEMLKQFPNSYELDRYAEARVSSMIRNYVPIQKDFEASYQKYRNRKQSTKGSEPRLRFQEYESDKFLELASNVEMMLVSVDEYSENQWQNEILQVIQLLYPKYIKAFREAPVWDSLARKNRNVDFLLMDASGYVDAVEIKKPFTECIVTSNRYRDNHVPMRELSGTVMQLEKYLYHLNRWGEAGENRLNDRYKVELPSGVNIKIVNPSGMIIMGRDNRLTPDQKNDFEVIRRKYRNIVEIMTYDDILQRLKTIREQFLRGTSNPHQ